jgi:hypothetical protein
MERTIRRCLGRGGGEVEDDVVDEGNLFSRVSKAINWRAFGKLIPFNACEWVSLYSEYVDRSGKWARTNLSAIAVLGSSKSNSVIPVPFP